ncbi:DUF2291 family protein, partial [Hydrogenophaga sp.]|uniref:DUF2291 family protein n=1 Tax=Hydrogenophaga sp. TaxID=1904254 RepID=UPI0035638731
MHTKNLIRMIPVVLMLGATGLALTGCKIERKSQAEQRANSSVAGSFENKSFDPKAEVQAMWDSKVLPAINTMAVDYPALEAHAE